MKKITFFVCVFALASAFINPRHARSGIHGIIDPPEAAKRIWAISGTDSFSTIPVAGGFSIEVKPGNWNLVVEAISPYKNAVVQNINVLEDQSSDAGVIKLTR